MGFFYGRIWNFIYLDLKMQKLFYIYIFFSFVFNYFFIFFFMKKVIQKLIGHEKNSNFFKELKRFFLFINYYYIVHEQRIIINLSIFFLF